MSWKFNLLFYPLKVITKSLLKINMTDILHNAFIFFIWIELIVVCRLYAIFISFTTKELNIKIFLEFYLCHFTLWR